MTRHRDTASDQRIPGQVALIAVPAPALGGSGYTSSGAKWGGPAAQPSPEFAKQLQDPQGSAG